MLIYVEYWFEKFETNWFGIWYLIAGGLLTLFDKTPAANRFTLKLLAK